MSHPGGEQRSHFLCGNKTSAPGRWIDDQGHQSQRWKPVNFLFLLFLPQNLTSAWEGKARRLSGTPGGLMTAGAGWGIVLGLAKHSLKDPLREHLFPNSFILLLVGFISQWAIWLHSSLAVVQKPPSCWLCWLPPLGSPQCGSWLPLERTSGEKGQRGGKESL